MGLMQILIANQFDAAAIETTGPRKSQYFGVFRVRTQPVLVLVLVLDPRAVESSRSTSTISLHTSTNHAWRVLACFLALTWAAAETAAQGISLIPNRKATPAMSRFDESTTVVLQVKNSAIIHSPLLRLRDVATPENPEAPWWDRAGAAIVGMMPVEDHEMIVDRLRLMEAVSRSTTMPGVQWAGANQIRVQFQREEAGLAGLKAADAVALSSHSELPRIDPSASPEVFQASVSTGRKKASMTQITPTERERITKLLQIAIDRYDVQLRSAFDIEIDPNQASIESLRDLRRVDSADFDVPPTDGLHVAKFVGMNSREAVAAFVEVTFEARPLVVVAREAIRREQVLSEADLTLMPVGRNVSLADVITDVREAVGLQVRSGVQKNNPVFRSNIAPVNLISRGDLVEVRVMGGGITIATGAKTLAAGARGDLIPVETLEPRKKLMARVADIGVVEILTRPPRVQ